MGLFDFLKRNKSSGPKFEVGETVICIDDRRHNVVYGKQYVILDVVQCSKCGQYIYDVGIKLNHSGFTICSNCNIDIQGKGIRWCGEFRFKKKVGIAASAKMEKSITIKTKEILEEELAYVGEN